jgi:hypothetical protein
MLAGTVGAAMLARALFNIDVARITGLSESPGPTVAQTGVMNFESLTGGLTARDAARPARGLTSDQTQRT